MGALVVGSQLKLAAAATERAGRLVAGAVPTASVLGTQIHHHHQQKQQQQQQPSSRAGSVSCSKFSGCRYYLK